MEECVSVRSLASDGRLHDAWPHVPDPGRLATGVRNAGVAQAFTCEKSRHAKRDGIAPLFACQLAGTQIVML